MVKRKAFTLVELLVVVGIIALLVSILMPVLSRARETARKAKCLSNLHQIMAATNQYCMENSGSLPWGGENWPNESFNNGLRLLKPYISTGSFFVCPSDNDPPFNVWWSTIGWGSQNGQSGVQYPFPSSYYYGYANYHKFTYTLGNPGNNTEGPPRAMRMTDVKYPTARGIFSCAAQWGGPGAHGPVAVLGFIDGHSQSARLDEMSIGVMQSQDLGVWHFDWTVNGLAGVDVK